MRGRMRVPMLTRRSGSRPMVPEGERPSTATALSSVDSRMMSHMRRFADRDFSNLHDPGGETYEGYEFDRCRFGWVTLSQGLTDPGRRSTIRNIRVTDCTAVDASIGPAIIDDVLVDGLVTTSRPLICWAPALRHVTLRGVIGRVRIAAHYRGGADPRLQQAFTEANDAFYRNVDWAIDITGMKSDDFELHGVPARLVRRDPETQVVVTRERVMRGAWRELDLRGTYWAVALESFLRSGRSDEVLIAPKRAKDFGILKAGLDLLRRAGVATPD